jgi:ABC-2 type transport system permease protein
MSDAAHALLYLRFMSARNMLVARVARLKRPKYLLGGIAGLAYVYLVFLRPAARHAAVGPLAGSDPDTRAALISIVALLLLIGLALCWVLPRERASLSFSDAEIAFLFPAPVRRTTLVHYRLLGTHLSVLLSAAVFFVLSMRWNLQPGGALMGVLGWWILWMTVQLHVIGSAFTLTRLTDAGVSRARGKALVSTMLALALAVGVTSAWREWQVPPREELAGGIAVARYISRLLAGSGLSWMLWPTRLLSRLLFAPDWRSFGVALGPALLLYAAHYIWVLRVQTTFEEAAVAKAEKRAAQIAAMRQGRSPLRASITAARLPRFALAPTGRPEMAFLWKNLLSTPNYVRPRTAIVLAAIVTAGSLWLVRPGHGDAGLVIGLVAAIAGGPSLFVFGPMVARQDLRSDLPNIDVLKTYPLRGWQIVLGEILTPLVIVCGIVWLLLVMVAFTFQAPSLPELTALVRVSGGVGLALLIVPIVAIEILALNALVVLFPAWSLSTPTPTDRGIEVTGQRLVLFAAMMIVILLSLAPAAVLGGAAYWIARWFASVPLAIGAASLGMLGVLVLETAIGVWFVGSRFDRFDLSAELQLQLK